MYIFQKLKKESKNVSFSDREEAKEWYRNKALEVSKVDRNKIMNTAGPFKLFNKLSGPAVGKMFMFFYDAKHKDTLPFFDMFPLVFPIEFYNDGFLGLNLHYLPPVARANLMDALYTTSNNTKYNNSMKLMISYQILKNASNKFSGYEQCIKRYLFGHVRSSFHYVNPDDWDKALLLPMQKWHINPNKYYSNKASPPY